MNIKHLFTIVASFGLVLISAAPNYAQATSVREKDPFQKNEVNPLYGGDGFNPLDLIHNANLSTGRSSADFYEDTNENLDSAAEKFKKEQLLRMQQQQNELQTDSNNVE